MSNNATSGEYTEDQFREDLRYIHDTHQDPMVSRIAGTAIERFDELIARARAEGAEQAESANNPYGVKVGQVWQDNDWRGDGRRGTVVSVENTHARVDWGANTTRIKLTRFKPTSTGYRLIQDVK